MAQRTRQISLKECYDILKIDKSADLAELKRAYRRRAFELHPDLNPDNPDASHDFQLLNEAYVALSAMLEHEERVRSGVGNHSATRATTKNAEQNAANDSSASSRTTDTETTSSTTDNGSHTDNAAGVHREATHKTAHTAYTEHDVLRDLLNDPFARRVFEDIYSELNRKQKDDAPSQPEPSRKEQPRTGHSPQKPASEKRNVTLHKENLVWGTPKWNKEMSHGVTSMVKGWLRRQIDEEQHLTLPSAKLAPGSRIRLQIRQAFTGDLKTIEITLPRDFSPGKPIRLRGLGKRVGPWQGDLYLTITNV